MLFFGFDWVVLCCDGVRLIVVVKLGCAVVKSFCAAFSLQYEAREAVECPGLMMNSPEEVTSRWVHQTSFPLV